MSNDRATRALPDDAKRFLTELWRCQLSADTRAQTRQELRECIRRVSARSRDAVGPMLACLVASDELG